MAISDMKTTNKFPIDVDNKLIALMNAFMFNGACEKLKTISLYFENDDRLYVELIKFRTRFESGNIESYEPIYNDDLTVTFGNYITREYS